MVIQVISSFHCNTCRCRCICQAIATITGGANSTYLDWWAFLVNLIRAWTFAPSAEAAKCSFKLNKIKRLIHIYIILYRTAGKGWIKPIKIFAFANCQSMYFRRYQGKRLALNGHNTIHTYSYL